MKESPSFPNKMKKKITSLKCKLSGRVPPNSRKDLSRISKSTKTGMQQRAFGDFFVRDEHAIAIKAERPSLYSTFNLSEAFQLEAEKVYTANLERTAIWKLDIRIIPIIGLFFFLSELGRLTLDRVRSLGLQEILQINDYEFTLSLVFTTLPLLLIEIPSNFILRRIGGRVFFSVLITLLGLVIFCHGCISNNAGLFAVRFFLGLINGGLFPGFLLYLSSLYERRCLQWRIGLFFSTSCLAGALWGPLAYLIARLDGKLGVAGWAWLFIIEGLCTALSGILGFFVLPSSCEDAGFLTPEEKRALSNKLQRDRSPLAAGVLLDAKPFRSSRFQMLQALTAPHICLSCFAFLFVGTNLASLTHFQANVVNSMDFTPTISQNFTIPPYALAFVTVLLSAYLSDRYHARAMTAVFSGGVSAVGFSIFYIAASSSIKYGSLFLIIPGTYAVIPSLAAWVSNNSAPYARKATGLALGPIAANFGGLISTLLLTSSSPSNDATASMLNVVFAILGVLTCLANLAYLTYAEGMKLHERDKVLQHYAINDVTVDPSVQDLLYLNGWEYLGDRHPDFRYSF